MSFSYPRLRGNVLRVTGPRHRQPRERTAKALRKGTLTYMAMCCSDATLQHLMPQLFVVNKRLTNARERRALRQVALEAAAILRFERSAWMTSGLMRICAGQVAELAHQHPTKQFALVMDTCPAHIAADFLDFAKLRNVWVLLVPAGMTWLLQPLDRGVFAPYKAYLKDQYRSLRAQSGGSMTREQWYATIVRSAHFARQGRWIRCFDSCGLGAWDGASQELQSYVSMAAAAAAPSMPVDADLRAMLPAGSSVHWRDLFALPAGLRRGRPYCRVVQ